MTFLQPSSDWKRFGQYSVEERDAALAENCETTPSLEMGRCFSRPSGVQVLYFGPEFPYHGVLNCSWRRFGVPALAARV